MANVYAILPGSMGAAQLAIDLFGSDRVNPGSWMSPVYAEIELEELQAATELLAEQGLTLREVRN
jgi:hypothetical protein